MADWYGTARSNYFHVKDAAVFKEVFGAYDVTIVDGTEGRFALISDNEYGGWPGWVYPEDGGDPVELDIAALLSEHLAPGAVAVLMEVGAEKARYVTGWALAVNERNEQRYVNLDSIYELAQELGENVTTAAY